MSDKEVKFPPMSLATKISLAVLFLILFIVAVKALAWLIIIGLVGFSAYKVWEDRAGSEFDKDEDNNA